MAGIIIGGVVTRRHEPLLEMDIDGHLARMSMAQARSIARDIERQCARTEADAMIFKFMEQVVHAPLEASADLMVRFRDFRAQLDAEQVEKQSINPDEDPNA